MFMLRTFPMFMTPAAADVADVADIRYRGVRQDEGRRCGDIFRRVFLKLTIACNCRLGPTAMVRLIGSIVMDFMVGEAGLP
jgi:hypothetical protein